MKKINCWEHTRCGREPGGRKAKELGVCRAAIEMAVDGVNSGQNAGRACWAISGTFCEGQVQGTFATKLTDCKQCSVYQLVQAEEGETFQDTREIRRAYMLSLLAQKVGEDYREVFHLR